MIGIFQYNVVDCHYIPYTVIALMTEINSIFLHSRKLMQIMQIPFDHWIYRTNVYFNLGSFIPCRFLNVIAIFYGLYLYHNVLTITHFALTCIANLVVFVINIVLFWRIMKNDIFYRKKLHVKKDAQLIIHNNNITRNGIVSDMRTEQKVEYHID